MTRFESMTCSIPTVGPFGEIEVEPEESSVPSEEVESDCAGRPVHLLAVGVVVNVSLDLAFEEACEECCVCPTVI